MKRTSRRCVTQLAKMSIEPNVVELPADACSEKFNIIDTTVVPRRIQ